jgi:hypothetical protein
MGRKGCPLTPVGAWALSPSLSLAAGVPAVRRTGPDVSWTTGRQLHIGALPPAFTLRPLARRAASIVDRPHRGMSVWEPTGRPRPAAASTPGAAGVTGLSRNPQRSRTALADRNANGEAPTSTARTVGVAPRATNGVTSTARGTCLTMEAAEAVRASSP